ncbi:unnamed protein product [Rotaria sordida]|uniref:Uncharacterized protein n=1 Tax=Rotaria sordida TaxID=392033 RepID=A0A813ZH14_9BILA|nr:unnamed protein product [Rotaria sordida]
MTERLPNPNPYLSASKWSQLFYGWVSPLLAQSRKEGTLQITDLYNLPPHLESTILTDKLETNCIIFNQSYYQILSLALQMRIAYTGLVFRKVLRLSSYSMNNISSGKITNILSNDASQIETVLIFLNYLWLSPLEIALVVYFFWYFVKYVALIAIGYTLVLLAIQTIFSRIFLHFQNKILQVTDERVKMMSEIIKSMRVIKMYCWESAIDKNICHVRKREIIQYACRSILDCIQLFFAVASCLLTYMRSPIVEFFSMGVKAFVHYMAAQKRIQTFLLLGESERDKRLLSRSETELASDEQNGQMMLRSTPTISPSVVCNLERAQWEMNASFSLDSIVFNAHPGDLICIVGPVGSGKSSLLQTLTGEISFFDGHVRLHGSFCYVPQESWIFSSTIKKNILLGKGYDPQLFQRVVQATALDSDFAQLSNGENTLVGDQGAMLSGGQKARVNMARALYRNADIYLLDDPLSAVDVKVAKHLFEKSIKGYLREKICILVTHQIQYLQNATKIILLYNGEIASMGTYNDLLTSSLLFYHLLDDMHQHEQEQSVDLHHEHEQEHPVDLCRQRSIINSTSPEIEEEFLVLSTSVETKQKGRLKWHVYAAYVRAGAGIVVGFLLVPLVLAVQQTAYIFSNWWLAAWNDDESYRHQIFDNCTIGQQHNTIWSMTDAEWNNYRNRRFYIYWGIILIFVLITLFRTAVIELMFLNAARVLHNKMFRQLIRAPIVFFDTNPVGRILNRFTKDVAIMDDSLPTDAFDFLDCCFQVFGVVVLVCWLHPWSIIPALISIGGLLFVRYHFASTSRDLKRLEGITRSPVYSHLTSTIHGLKVIRSYRAEDMWSANFLERLDDNTRANYLIIATNRWAAIRFDWVALIFVSLVTLLAMVLRVTKYHHFSPAEIALVLSYSLSLVALLQWTIRQSVVIETQMTSVERVLDYCSLDQEPPAQVPHDLRPPSNWPSHGQIVFDNVSMRHSTQTYLPLDLRHISMTIQGGEKVGIVGRTGAGKSSLIQTLFRMGTLVDGQIKIDNIDIASVGLDDVRRRISIIPQDPVLFTGTMRSNLDPFMDYSDEEIWHALEQVQLKTLVTEGMPNGLHSMVSESGSNLSVGQKQLVCLARAILKQSKILVIDEATANVDNVTDGLIQRTIREKFSECTVLTVAHRLRTVIDSDRILVLSNGKLLEFDTPVVLLSNPTSHFTSLVEQGGSVEAKHLRALANAKSLQQIVDHGCINDDMNINTN